MPQPLQSMTKERNSGKLPLSIVAMNSIPLAYLGGLAAVLFFWRSSALAVMILALLWIYLLPPLLGRVTLMMRGWPETDCTMAAGSFKTWFFLTQLQTLYNRLPFLEELLRLVPGCYSFWLCLWGSRVSPLVMWSPGVTVTDRYLLEIEPYAVLGLDVLLSPHLVSNNKAGEMELIIGVIRVGRGAVIGGKASLGPGSRVDSGESFPATRVLGPFHVFANGRRRSPKDKATVSVSSPETTTHHEHE